MTNFNVLIRTWTGLEKKFQKFCRKVTQGLKFKPWTLILSYQNQIKVKQLASGDQLISSSGGQKFSNKKNCSKFSLLDPLLFITRFVNWGNLYLTLAAPIIHVQAIRLLTPVTESLHEVTSKLLAFAASKIKELVTKKESFPILLVSK